ncbi:CpsD/CapB family tyrosine-protein kinase [Virgibacillus sp. W0181]|uniref:CpsD/CapB family tyrosine-protein kinase n=1 Tax=Virgibacillus sp. W0181 TaxID=3391581 RepID=UPI003F49017F
MILNKKPRNKGGLITYSHADSVIADQFRMIRANINFLPGKRANRIFLMSSAGKGEGKSTIISNLAVSMAQQKEKILLIDANLREPVIHDFFETPNDKGLTDILSRKSTFDEVVYKTGIGQLDLLTSGSTLFNPAELLGNEMMSVILQKVTNIYHVVLIDSPTILDYTETRVLANECDGVILVVNRKKTTKEKVAEARRVLELAHANTAGVIINDK